MTPRRTLLPLLATLAACATARVNPRPAHGTYDPAQATRAATGALEALKARGFELAFHDALRGLFLTQTREGPAACGRGPCLARDTYVIRLEAGGAVAVLSREIFDDALRTWVPPRAPEDLDAVEADEVAMLAAFLAEPPTLRASRVGESCAGTGSCAAGLLCASRRCREPGASSPAP